MRSLILLPEIDWLEKLPFSQDELRHTALVIQGDETSVETIKKQGYLFGELRAVQNYDQDDWIEVQADKIYQQLPFERIVAPDENDILRAARLRHKFHLEGQSIESALAFQDKLLMKDFVSQAGLQVPAFQSIKDLADIREFIGRYGYPVILKPVRATGCQGLLTLESDADLKRYREQGVFDGFRNYMIESFIPGPMYHTDGLVIDGKLVCCWPSIYLDLPLNIISGNYASSYLLSAQNTLVRKLNTYTKQIIQALPTPKDTAFHLEFFLPNEREEPVFCEIASRVGGKGVNDDWTTSFGIDLKQTFLRMQAGLPLPSIAMPEKPAVLSGEVWIPKQKGQLNHIENTCPLPWVKKYEVYAKTGDFLDPTGTLNDLLGGSPLLVSDSEDEMKERIQAFAKWFHDTTRISSDVREA